MKLFLLSADGEHVYGAVSCSKCGKVLASDDSYCPRCGRKLVKIPTTFKMSSICKTLTRSLHNDALSDRKGKKGCLKEKR